MASSPESTSLDRTCNDFLDIVKMILVPCSITPSEREEKEANATIGERKRFYFLQLDTSSGPEVYMDQLFEATIHLVSGLPEGTNKIINLCLYKAPIELVQPGPVCSYSIPLCLSWIQQGERTYTEVDPGLRTKMNILQTALQDILFTNQQQSCLSGLQTLSV